MSPFIIVLVVVVVPMRSGAMGWEKERSTLGSAALKLIFLCAAQCRASKMRSINCLFLLRTW